MTRIKETLQKDAFDQWWEWANKPEGDRVSIPAEIHNAVMSLTEAERKDRVTVNRAVWKHFPSSR